MLGMNECQARATLTLLPHPEIPQIDDSKLLELAGIAEIGVFR
jgi:hypothetical protein